MLASAGGAMLKWKSSLFQRHPDARDAALVPASYYELGLSKSLHNKIHAAAHTSNQFDL